jgi:hypothetical protein
MTTKGTLKANALELSRLEVDWRQVPMKCVATAALVNTEQGSTHAWLTSAGVQWSKETAEALQRLKTCLESDLANVHFVDGATPGTTTPDVLPRGLGEHLGASDDVPSV